MPGQVGAVGLARVDVADAFVVGKEVHPVSDPARAAQIALDLQQWSERAGAIAVDPYGSRGAPAVPLPPGGLTEGIACYHHRPVRSICDPVGRPDWKCAGQAARGADRI